jgi:hypothetical protein
MPKPLPNYSKRDIKIPTSNASTLLIAIMRSMPETLLSATVSRRRWPTLPMLISLRASLKRMFVTTDCLNVLACADKMRVDDTTDVLFYAP